jgi:DNA polymerase I-like protein with 3'-5' exonuclease and polymerase domains
MIAHHTMFSNQPKGLDYLSSIYCEQHIYWKQESKNWDPKLGEEQLWIYNCRDAVKTYEIAFAEMKAVDKFANGGWPELPQILQFQHDLWWAVLETMNRGIRVTEKDKATLAQELIEEIAKREQWLIDVIGRPVNIKSPKQMTDLFYRELGQKPVISRKTGNPTCDSQALEKIGEREPLLLPVIRVIEELRSLGVFLGTFVTAPLDIDRRMRCSFNIAGTETYRFSSSQNAFGSGMNLQNIPKGDD